MHFKDYPKEVSNLLELFDEYLSKPLKKIFPSQTTFDLSFYHDLIVESEMIETIPITFNASNISIIPYSDLEFDEGILLSTLTLYSYQGIKYVSVITPFFSTRPFKFIVTPQGDLKKLVNAYYGSHSYEEETSHIIGTAHLELEKHVINFLTDKDWHKFMRERNIKIKRGICLQGEPGMGKTLSLRYLKKKCSENGIYFRHFEGAKDFMDNASEMEKRENAVFVFEDFDSFAIERDKNTGPNQILQTLLNVLDGIDTIDKVVSIFTTNHIENIDSAMLRPGRIDKVFELSLPTENDIREFFNMYLKDYSEMYEDILEVILSQNKFNPGMSHIKGICDDINMQYLYNGMKKPTLDDIKTIVKDSLNRKNKLLKVTKSVGF